MIKSKGKKLDLSLSITLTLFLASTPFILIFFYLGKVWVSVFLAVVDLAFIFFYFLGRKGYVWAPTVGTILLANLSTYFFNIILGSNTQIYILFFPFVILPLIVVDIRKRVTRAVLTGIPSVNATVSWTGKWFL